MATNVEDVQQRLVAYLENQENPQNETSEEDTPQEASDEVESVEDESSTEETETSEEESEEADAPEEPQLELSELSEYLGIDNDKLDVTEDGELVIKTKIDGQEGTAKLNDLIKSYQLEGHLNKQNMEVAEMKKALQEKQSQFDVQMQERLTQAEDMIKVAWQQLEYDIQNDDIDQKLRDGEIDQGEYALTKMRQQERQQQLTKMFQEVQQQRQPNTERINEVKREEAQKLIKAIPEWADQTVLAKEYNEVINYMKSMGFTDNDIDNAIDHRIYVAFRKAHLFDSLEKSKPDISKKVRHAPKLTKPGQRASREDESTNKLKNLTKTVKKTGGGDKKAVNDFLAAKGII